jgi:hypothetical protein
MILKPSLLSYYFGNEVIHCHRLRFSKSRFTERHILHEYKWTTLDFK